jgi:hypothetical protein
MEGMTDEINIIQSVLERHAAVPYAYGEIETVPVFDRERGHFLLMDVGWLEGRRYHGCLVHIALRDDAVRIEHDGLEEGVAGELIEAGIAADRIVIGAARPDHRLAADSAVA